MSCSEANPSLGLGKEKRSFGGNWRRFLFCTGGSQFHREGHSHRLERQVDGSLWKPYLEAFWLPPKYCRAGHLSPLDFLKAGLLHLTDGSTSDPCYFAKFPRREKSAESKNNEESACAAGQLRSIKRYAEQEPEGTGPRGEAKNETEKKSSDIATSMEPLSRL